MSKLPEFKLESIRGFYKKAEEDKIKKFVNKWVILEKGIKEKQPTFILDPNMAGQIEESWKMMEEEKMKFYLKDVENIDKENPSQEDLNKYFVKYLIFGGWHENVKNGIPLDDENRMPLDDENRMPLDDENRMPLDSTWKAIKITGDKEYYTDAVEESDLFIKFNNVFKKIKPEYEYEVKLQPTVILDDGSGFVPQTPQDTSTPQEYTNGRDTSTPEWGRGGRRRKTKKKKIRRRKTKRGKNRTNKKKSLKRRRTRRRR